MYAYLFEWFTQLYVRITQTMNEDGDFKSLCDLIERGSYFDFYSALREFRNVDHQDSNGLTLLHIAVGCSNFQALVEILARGANP